MKNQIKSQAALRQKFDTNRLWEWQASQKNRPLFILHDGPPYANGPLHMGHFLNKIQKDVICRYKLLNGYKIDFRPGWDCHARQFATDAIELQKKEFQSWSILADWNNCYKTFDKEYIIDEIKLFWKLYEKVRRVVIG
ncbi:unnamed protein product [Didymodactylos carnosus]|uniref:Aminoacyl-tRNA synthetase class Ia domain-containing protein n=1 Tax=Didymodactylos carnosus TaxID=1234261 RepID=A0A8S2I1Q5_9BILA|nr:unnamed protein product [Didymodactylos carnosus]CAF3708992.1 unnamed protein product [Didymodactylos carnosus]